MKNGNEILHHSRRLFFLMALVLVGFAFNSCKSSRNVVEETRTEFHYSGQDSTRVDSVLMGGNERTSESDTTSVSTGATGTVEIKRDSAGRASKIIWTRSAIVSTLSKRDKEAQNWFYGLNATRHSESSGAVDSVNEKTEGFRVSTARKGKTAQISSEHCEKGQNCQEEEKQNFRRIKRCSHFRR